MSTVKMMAEQVAKKLGRGIEIDARHEKDSPNRIWILVRRPDKELGEIGMRFGPFRRNEVGKALAMFADMLDMAS